MALPSQMQSSPVRGRYVYRRRRKRRGPVLLAAVVAFVVAFWFAYDWGEEEGAASEDSTQKSVMAVADPLASNVSREVMSTTSAPPRWTPAASEPVVEEVPPPPTPPARAAKVPQKAVEVPAVVEEVAIPVVEAPSIREVPGGAAWHRGRSDRAGPLSRGPSRSSRRPSIVGPHLVSGPRGSSDARYAQ